MEDEIISYETAVLAKEKGFDEKTDAFYREDKQLKWAQYYDATPRNSAFDSEDNWFSGREKFKPIATAPRQSELQRWLREKHTIYCGVAPVIYAGDKVASYYQATLNTNTISYKQRFENYESALEHSLQEGLKLIKT